MSLIKSITHLKCPRCRKGNLFTKRGLFCYSDILEMEEKCSNCKLHYELEPGFWLGALWASYPLIMIIELPFLIGILINDKWSPLLFIGLMALSLLILLPLLLRLGRSIWIHAQVRYRDNK